MATECVCAVCGLGVERSAGKTCARCLGVSHFDCWTALGGCAAGGSVKPGILAVVLGCLVVAAGMVIWSLKTEPVVPLPLRWNVHQGNNYHHVWELRRLGSGLDGMVHVGHEEGLRAGYGGALSQRFQGAIEGDQIAVRIVWKAKRDGTRSVGNYRGTLTGNRIEGTCFDENDPKRPRYRWNADAQLVKPAGPGALR
jgi:hypothetical protein